MAWQVDPAGPPLQNFPEDPDLALAELQLLFSPLLLCELLQQPFFSSASPVMSGVGG